MLWFIIDGYNVIKQHKKLKRLNISEARQQLKAITLRQIAANKATLVYDGSSLHSTNPIREKSLVEEVFSRGESADDYIKRIIKKAENPSQMVIITDDREIQHFAKQYKIKFESVKTFLKQKKNTEQKQKPLKPKDIREINIEIQNIWEEKYS